MHLLPSLRHFAGLALAVCLAMPVLAQDPPPPPEQQQPPAAQPAPDQAASGQKPSKPRGGSRGAVPAAKPAKATQPSRIDTRKPSPDSGQPAPAPSQQPGGQPAPQDQPPPAPPKADGLLKMLQALPNTPAKPILPPAPAPAPTPAPALKKRAQKTAPAPAAPAPATSPPAASAPAAPAAPAGAAAAPQSPPVNPPPAAQPAPVQAQPASPAPAAASSAPPAASAPPQPPSPELGVKPFAPGAAVTPAASAARSGELNPNTYFADWKDGAPALWTAQNNENTAAAKPGPPEANGVPSLEMVPEKSGWVSLIYQISAVKAGLMAGDSILYEVELRADLGVPMDLRMRMFAPGQKDPTANLRLPYVGEGVWRTLRLAVTIPPAPVESMDVMIRVRGAKPGSTAWVRRASVMLIPPV